MPKVDADFLSAVHARFSGTGLEWCEAQDIDRLALCEKVAHTAAVAAQEDAGLASYGVAMFKLGYEVRWAQENMEQRKFESDEDYAARLGSQP